MKKVGEREIFASLVEFKHHSMAKTIQKRNEEDKIKVKAPVKAKKIIKSARLPAPQLQHFYTFMPLKSPAESNFVIRLSKGIFRWLR